MLLLAAAVHNNAVTPSLNLNIFNYCQLVFIEHFMRFAYILPFYCTNTHVYKYLMNAITVDLNRGLNCEHPSLILFLFILTRFIDEFYSS